MRFRVVSLFRCARSPSSHGSLAPGYDPMANQLSAIKHIVQLMMENRSFDQMLGFLYEANGNKSPTGQPFEGLTGAESNPDDTGREVKVFKIDDTADHPYLMPGADPGEGFFNTNAQLFSTDTPAQGEIPTNK